jgi:hypothetical protein
VWLTKLDKGLRAGDNSATSCGNAVGRGPRRIDAVKRIFSEGLCLGGPPRRDYLIGYGSYWYWLALECSSITCATYRASLPNLVRP